MRRDRPIYEIPRTDDIRHISAEDYENSASLKLKRVEHFKIYFSLCSTSTLGQCAGMFAREIFDSSYIRKLHEN